MTLLLTVAGLTGYSLYVHEDPLAVFKQASDQISRLFESPDTPSPSTPEHVAIAPGDEGSNDFVQFEEAPTAESTPAFQPEPTLEHDSEVAPETEVDDGADYLRTVAELRQYALGLVNEDRAAHGLPPVAMGANQAAQLHAEDMLEHDYQGHWWVDGRKPYMVYSETGGTSYAAENVASMGWTDDQWQAEHCGSFRVVCRTTPPHDAIRELQWLMMYDDAHADWGHRDNILGKSHRKVNIGIAFNKRRVVFVQHFEGGAVEASRPTIAQGVLSLRISYVERGVEVWPTINLYHDPLPTRRMPEEIEALDSYCTGGGFTARCGDPIAYILEPPPTGAHYVGLDPNDVVASLWGTSPNTLQVMADLGSLVDAPGVYTVVVFNATGSDEDAEVLISLTATG